MDFSIFKKIIDNKTDGVIIADEERKIIYSNDSFTKMTGYKKNDILESNTRRLRSDFHNDNFYEMMFDSIRNKSFWNGEIWDITKDGTPILVWLEIIKLLDDNNKPLYVAFYKNLSSEYYGNQKLMIALKKDPLTGVLNRTYFYERANYLIKNNLGFYLIFFDLINFKKFNDQFGHLMGDKILSSFGRVLANTFPDCLPARFGGDEFILLITKNASPKQLEERLDLLELELIKIFSDEGFIVETVFNAGIAKVTNDTENVNQLIERADVAMYKAKRAKKKYQFDLGEK